MSLKQWASNGWLSAHRDQTPKEIQDLLAIVKRDLADAEGDISADWQFGIAYNAALKLCTILMRASGHRPEKTLQHYRTLQALPLVLVRSARPMPTISTPAASSATLWNTIMPARPHKGCKRTD